MKVPKQNTGRFHGYISNVNRAWKRTHNTMPNRAARRNAERIEQMVANVEADRRFGQPHFGHDERGHAAPMLLVFLALLAIVFAVACADAHAPTYRPVPRPAPVSKPAPTKSKPTMTNDNGDCIVLKTTTGANLYPPCMQ